MDEKSLNIAMVIVTSLTGISAILLSVIPAFIKIKNVQKNSRTKITHVFKIINRYFEENRLLNTKMSKMGEDWFYHYDPVAIGYKIDIISLLESIKEDIIKANYKETTILLEIYYLCYEVFSGLKKEIILWYLLEAKIVEFFNLDSSQKKYLLYEKEEASNIEKINYCRICNRNYDKNDFLSYEKLDTQRKYISKILNIDFCKNDNYPMHIKYINKAIQ